MAHGGDVTWTKAQRQAIEADGVSLLVSAAAGSGKTAVLAARCVRLISEQAAPGAGGRTVEPAEACGVENLLVVTFTNAAARQMKERIARRLRQRVEELEAQGHSEAATRAARELQLLPRAHISTLSSFCSGLVRRHFHAAGVDPNFAVLDGDQSRLLRRQVARELFDERYEHEESAGEGPFQRLVDLYADGFDPGLMEKVIACHELLTSVADRQRWKREALERVRDAAERPLTQSALGAARDELVSDALAHMLGLAAQAVRATRAAATRDPKLSKLAGYADKLAGEAAEWNALHANGQTARLAARAAAFSPDRKPSVQKTMPAKHKVDAAVLALKEAMGKGEVRALLEVADEVWREGMAAVAEPTAVFLELVEAFEQRYALRKAAMRALDFADLERKTLDLLMAPGSGTEVAELRPSPIAMYYQRQFHHVLVDEFQDINEVQDRILRLLSRETAPPEGLGAASLRPNLFCVGDVKQSIYRFRLAEPEQFRRRAEEIHAGRLAHARLVPLQTNFRSRKPLLDAINAAFFRLLSDEKRLDLDYADDHELNADNDYPPVPEHGFSGAPIEIHVLEPAGAAAEGEAGEGEAGEEGAASNGELAAPAQESELAEAERIEREAAFIASRIRQWRAEGRQVLGEGGESEKLSYRHVAVLLRAMKHQSEKFARVLRRMGVPCHSETGTGFFSSMEVRDILSLLRVLDNRRQDIPLAAVLRSPLADVPDVEELLARVRLKYPPERMPFFEAVLKYATREDDAAAARLRHALSRLEHWRRLAHRRPLAELVWQVYSESGYLGYVAGLHDGEQRVANLLELHRRAGQFDAFQRQGLGAFMQFLESLEDAGEVGQPPLVSEAEDAVRVMSVHAAKGQEFPVVFLADCGKGHNLQDTRSHILLERELGVAMQAVDAERQVRYPTLVHELARRSIRRAGLAEELRILYVAMTRAREHLVCVGTVKTTSRQSTQDIVGAWSRFGEVARLHAVDVLAGKSLLDWLGMAAAGAPGHFSLDIVPAAAADALVRHVSGRSKPPAVDKRLARLDPLESCSPLEGAARAAVERLTRTYEFAHIARLPAAQAVTRLSHPEGASASPHLPARAGAPAARAPAARAADALRRPTCLDSELVPSASDVGTATHLVLRHLDFRDAADENAVRRQIEAMVARRQLHAGLAPRVDAAAIAWFAATPLGQRLAANQDALLRELPVRAPADPGEISPEFSGPTAGPMDRILLRGQVDVVLPLAEGLVVADYKTDRLRPPGKPGAGGEAEAVGQILEAYRPQVDVYRRTLERVTARPVVEAYLVLLAARRVEAVACARAERGA